MTDMLQEIISRKREAENLFAGAAFLRPDLARENAGWLQASDIQDERVRKFWEEIKNGNDGPGAALAVGTDYLAEIAGVSCSEMVFFGASVHQYADRIAREQWFFAIGSRLGELAKTLYAGDLEKSQRIINDISSHIPKAANEIPDVADVGIDFVVGLNEENQTLFTGTPLDKATGGLWRSNLSVLCARPRIGKTAFGFQIARNVAKQYRVLFVSLEMDQRSLWARAVCGVTRIAYRDVMARRVNEEQKERLIEANANLIDGYSGRLLIDDRPQSTSDLWRKIASVQPDLVVVDHIRLLLDKNENEVRRLGEITWSLKQIAKEFDLHVMALAQLNRNPENRSGTDKRPALSDLRDSGQIEENADLVLGLHRDCACLEKQMEKTPADLLVLKFRNGPAELLIHLQFDGLAQWFEATA
jgi:replicative DNA helicase